MKDHYTPQGHTEPDPGPYIPGTQIPMKPMSRVEAWLKRIAETIASVFNTKQDKNIGAENAGKTLIADENGDLQPGEGGGSDQDVVKTVEQELTEDEKMQARKNQGLYYSETTAAEPIIWDGDTTGRINFTVSVSGQSMTFYKVSETVFSVSDLIGGTFAFEYEGQTTTVELTEDYVFDQQGMTIVYGTIVSANSGSYLAGIYNIPEDGTYIVKMSGYSDMELTPHGIETVYKIDEKYIPETKGDLYVINATFNETDESYEVQVDRTYSEITSAVENGLFPVIVGTEGHNDHFRCFMLTLHHGDTLSFVYEGVSVDHQPYFEVIRIDDENDVVYFDGSLVTMQELDEKIGEIESVLETI